MRWACGCEGDYLSMPLAAGMSSERCPNAIHLQGADAAEPRESILDELRDLVTALGRAPRWTEVAWGGLGDRIRRSEYGTLEAALAAIEVEPVDDRLAEAAERDRETMEMFRDVSGLLGRLPTVEEAMANGISRHRIDKAGGMREIAGQLGFDAPTKGRPLGYSVKAA